MQIKIYLCLIGVVFLAACASTSTGSRSQEGDVAVGAQSTAFASTYVVPESADYVIRNARVLLGNGESLTDADILFSGGKIVAVGSSLDVAAGTVEVNGRGKWVTPGLIDVHSHMGVYPNPSISSHSDGNEIVGPNTAGVWAEHAVWPQDPNFEKAIQGGVTTAQILPGSANLFGGRSVVLKIVPSTTMLGMKFPNAPHGLKMACGENPKRVYGQKGGPYTRMGNVAGYRNAWIDAQEYLKSWEGKSEGDEGAPKRDLRLETLAGVLKGEILVHNHCYRADEMANMIELSKEFGYKISTFHHAIEAYKIAPLLAKNGVCSAVWADWWGFKQEAFDMVRENAALLDYAGACAIIHSDDETQIQRLPQEVAKVLSAATQMGIELTAAQGIRWLTQNPAKALGLDDQIGTIEVGKNADLVLWDGNPFSVYTKAEKVWIDGALRSDISDHNLPPTSDFNIGIITPAEDRP